MDSIQLLHRKDDSYVDLGQIVEALAGVSPTIFHVHVLVTPPAIPVPP